MPQALQTTAESPRGGYYPGGAIARGEQMLQQPGAYESFQERIARPVLRGADPGRNALGLGFTPTQNASLGVASRGAANGTYSQFARSPTGELFARKPGERPPTPFPPAGPDTAEGPPGAPENVRDALAATITPPPPGIAPNARVASLGGAGPLGAAGAASAVIPPTLPPSMPPPVSGGPAGAVPSVPPAPYANPPTPTDIAPRPQVAQAQVPPPPPPAGQPFSPRTVPLSDAKPPDQTPISDNEKLATMQMIRAQNSGDLGRANTWKTVVDQLAARRTFLDKQNEEMWKARTGRATTDIAGAQSASRKFEEMQAKGELPGPSQSAAPDPNIGTPQSQQRKGYPDVPQRPPEIPL